MKSSYYYLVSSLPFLFFDKKLTLSLKNFKDECKKWLNDIDFKIINKIDINSYQLEENDNFIIKKWKFFNKDFKEDIAKQRKILKKHSSDGGSVFYRQIFDEKNPLLMEKQLERIRWDFIEGYESWYNFDLNWLILYSLKLQINERLEKFDKEKGKKRFGELSEISQEITYK